MTYKTYMCLSMTCSTSQPLNVHKIKNYYSTYICLFHFRLSLSISFAGGNMQHSGWWKDLLRTYWCLLPRPNEDRPNGSVHTPQTSSCYKVSILYSKVSPVYNIYSITSHTLGYQVGIVSHKWQELVPDVHKLKYFGSLLFFLVV